MIFRKNMKGWKAWAIHQPREIVVRWKHDNIIKQLMKPEDYQVYKRLQEIINREDTGVLFS